MISYNQTFFDQILRDEDELLDSMLLICQDPRADNKIKLFASQVLVHYALNSKSMDTIIQKGVFKIFSAFNWDHINDLSDETTLKVSLLNK